MIGPFPYDDPLVHRPPVIHSRGRFWWLSELVAIGLVLVAATILALIHGVGHLLGYVVRKVRRG